MSRAARLAFPLPTADEPRYERVHRVLRRYDEHLSKEEREFLKLFSVFRLPVQESAFEKVFGQLLSKSTAKNAKDTQRNYRFTFANLCVSWPRMMRGLNIAASIK